MHGGPSTMTPHIQSEFEGGIKWGHAKAQHQQMGAQHKGTKVRPSVKLKQRWGCMAQFDGQGKTMGLVLSTELGQPLHAILFVCLNPHFGCPRFSLAPPPPTLGASCNISTLWGHLGLGPCVATGIVPEALCPGAPCSPTPNAPLLKCCPPKGFCQGVYLCTLSSPRVDTWITWVVP